jgi:branched-chain amino acid aminotransferase
VKNGKLKTTLLASTPPGITRDSIIQIAKAKKITMVEEPFTRDERYAAREAFFYGDSR